VVRALGCWRTAGAFLYLSTDYTVSTLKSIRFHVSLRWYNRAGRRCLDRLRQIREQAGYSQQDLADESGVSQHTISEIELGRRKPQGRTLRKLAKVLGVEVRDLLEETDHPLAQAPLPENQQRRARPGIEVGEAFFVPLEDGEEPDTVTIEIHYVRLFEGDEPILKAVRKASPEEAAELRHELEKSGRSLE
jgi:transcriptional regulator with XRE-family HTH domain